MNQIYLNEYDLKQIKENGFVDYGKYIVMTKAKYKELNTEKPPKER